MFTQGQRVGQRLRESWNLCSYSVVKLHEATEMFTVVDYVRELTEKKSCKYGEYGSFALIVLSFFFL